MDDSNATNNKIYSQYSNIIARFVKLFILSCLLSLISIANCQSLDLTPI